VWQANHYQKQIAAQAHKYVKELADKDQVYGAEREQAAFAAMEKIAEAKSRRHALEISLQEQAQTHWKELKDAQTTQDRLRGRLATADLRLSVLVAAGASSGTCSDCGLRQAAATGSVDHGATRVELDPAHAQRIISISDEGDRGLLALRACQAYVRELSK
jgi:hypothetical protein